MECRICSYQEYRFNSPPFGGIGSPFQVLADTFFFVKSQCPISIIRHLTIFFSFCVSDKSAEMFLALFVKQSGPILVEAIVIQVMDHSMDCVLSNMGITKRVYVNR